MNYIISPRKVFLNKKSELHLYYIMEKVKSREKICEGCKVKYGRWARLRKLTEHDITVMPSGLKGKINKGNLLCKNCYGNQPSTLSNIILKSKMPIDEAGTSTASDMDLKVSPEKKIKLDILAAQSSSVKCIVCQQNRHTNSSANLTKLSPKQRANLFIKTGIIVNKRTRVCVSHVNAEALKDDCYGKITCASESVNIESNIESNEIAELLNEMREIANKNNVLNFDSDDAVIDEHYARLTGITKDQFNIVHKSLSFLRSTS